jgi:phosphoglycolate phosphatase-like HAD superfamily hydrolase
MKPPFPFRAFALAGVTIALLGANAGAGAASDPLPAWNSGPAKQAILDFVRVTTDPSNPKYVKPGDRIATFDQDGTLWVEQPLYTQVVFALNRVLALAPQHPEWKTTQPFEAVIDGDRAAMAKFTTKDLEAIALATHTGMTVESFQAAATAWIAAAKNPRWNVRYTDLTYEPMLEVIRYLRANGYKTYIVTGGGQDFVRSYAQRVYGVPPEQVIGTALDTTYTYEKNGKPVLVRTQKVLLNNDLSGKPEDIYLFVGRRPQAAFGNSVGDQQMLEYTGAGDGARLMMLVLHDDAKREYAYGPAAGLPNSKIGTFTQALYDEAKAKGWIVISMKRDWNRIFGFEP